MFEAVTRTNEDSTKSLSLDNKLTRGQALYAYTQGSAYAEFAEKHKGKLAPGYDADFIITGRDIYRVIPASVLETKILQIWVTGTKAYPSSVE